MADPGYSRFSRPRLSRRQFVELLGLCRGLLADGKIDQDEAEALWAWLAAHEEFGNPHVAALRDRVGAMLEDRALDAEESVELAALAKALIMNHSASGVPVPKGGRLDDHRMAELVGLCRGLLADGKLNRDEAAALHAWLLACAGDVDNPVLAEFQRLLLPALKQKEPKLGAEAHLLRLLSGLVGGRTEVGECLGATQLWLDEPPPQVRFRGRKFCLTGKFLLGRRKVCEDAVRQRGGLCQASPSRATDYVVIGAYAEDAWIQSAFGRKIERAVALRAEGSPVRIIAESHWRASLK